VSIVRGAGAAAWAVLVACSFVGYSADAAAPPTSTKGCVPEAVGADSFCVVNGVRLHYLDWGGPGPVVVLLTGLGDSARIYDEFAPLLNRQHRVIAVTRRGYGLSGAPADDDYSNGALVADLIGLLDALGIARASFVGHSIAGGELAALGERHPQRVERLVYLDAAYDRTPVPELMARLPPLPQPDAETRADFEHLARWRQSVLGVDSPAVVNSLAQVLVRTTDGWMPRTSQATGAKVLAGDIASRANWRAIRAPSLALYSSKDVADQVPPTASAAQRQAMLDYSIRSLRPWMLRAQADFIEQSACAAALEVPRSTHYLFLEHPQWTADAVLSFLSSEDPCHWRTDKAPNSQD
jgi:pimeloyl-ACP methyl ester carboxylesterase